MLPTVIDLADALRRGRADSVTVVRALLERISRYDDDLHAVVTTSPEALEQAARLDDERRRGRLRGVLHGVPLVVKDNLLTRDMPTSVGSAVLAGYQPGVDATVVARLREAGAIVLATTAMSEFAWHGTFTRSSRRGTTGNAFDPRLSASGSSGGSAVAVAAGFAPAAIATDSCGSIVGPAAHASLVGLRPTRGRLPVDGVVPLSSRQDVVGPITRTVADAALLARVAAGEVVGPDPSRVLESLGDQALAGRRVGHLAWRDEQWRAVAPPGAVGVDEVLANTRAALAAVAAAGAELVPLHLSLDELAAAVPSGGWVDVRPGLDDFFARHPWPGRPGAWGAGDITFAAVMAAGGTTLEPEVVQQWLAQPGLPNPVHDASGCAQQEGMRTVDEYFAHHRLDAVAIPTSIALATRDWAGTTLAEVASNSGVPSIQLPSGASRSGLPTGLTLVGRRGRDEDLLALALDLTRRHDRRVVPTWPHP